MGMGMVLVFKYYYLDKPDLQAAGISIFSCAPEDLQAENVKLS